MKTTQTRLLHRAALGLAVLLLGACAHALHEVHVSDFSPGSDYAKGRMVSAQAEQFVVLGFVGDTRYVDAARAGLLARCPAGRLEGITTQYSTDLGFFSWTNRILMKGLCLPAASVSA